MHNQASGCDQRSKPSDFGICSRYRHLRYLGVRSALGQFHLRGGPRHFSNTASPGRHPFQPLCLLRQLVLSSCYTTGTRRSGACFLSQTLECSYSKKSGQALRLSAIGTRVIGLFSDDTARPWTWPILDLDAVLDDMAAFPIASFNDLLEFVASDEVHFEGNFLVICELESSLANLLG